MSSERQHKKPTGAIGPLVIAPGEQPPFRPIAFPDTKAEIEDLILALAVKALMHQPNCPWRSVPTRNPEAHFDFTISESPPEYLDAMEVALLKGPYSTAPYTYNHGEIAESIWTVLTQKALGYGESDTRRIHLLLYSTHLPFRLSPGVIDTLSYCLVTSNRGLTSVVYVVPEDRESADVAIVHPRPAEKLTGVSLRRAYGRRSLIGRFDQSASDSVAVGVPLGGLGDRGGDTSPNTGPKRMPGGAA